MKTLKIVLAIVAAMIVLPLLVALFVKQDYAVERSIVINRPTEEVYDYVKYLKNQDKCSKWANMVSDMKKVYTGEDGTVGFVSYWESKNENVGIGEQEIKNMVEGERIEMELRFIKPFEATEKAYMLTQPLDSASTKLVWGFNGKMNYPTNLFLLFMNMEKMIGDDFTYGLNNYKKEIESL